MYLGLCKQKEGIQKPEVVSQSASFFVTLLKNLTIQLFNCSWSGSGMVSLTLVLPVLSCGFVIIKQADVQKPELGQLQSNIYFYEV